MQAQIIASPTERIKQAFSISGLKQVELVEKTGIDKGSISLYLSGKVTPKGDKLCLLARALDVDPEWLSGFDVPMKQTLIERFILETYRKADTRQKNRIAAFIEQIANEIE